MAKTIEIRPLRRKDDRSDFSCGQADLDRFFRHYAGQNQFKLGITTTYIALLANRIAAFATVVVGSVERSSLPTRRLRKKLPAYPLPVLRLARLGVDHRAQGRGLGRALLCHVLRLAVQQRDSLGCVGVVTDAKEDAVPFYETFGFMPLASVQEGVLHGDPTPMFLAMETILAATKT